MSSEITLYQGHQGELLLDDRGQVRPVRNQEVALQYLQIQRAFEQGAIATTQLHQAQQYLVEKERESYGLAMSAMGTAIQAHQLTNTVLVEENRGLREQNTRLLGLAEKLADSRQGGDVEFTVEIQSGPSWGWHDVAPFVLFLMLVVGVGGILSFLARGYEYHMLRQQLQQRPVIERSL